MYPSLAPQILPGARPEAAPAPRRRFLFVSRPYAPGKVAGAAKSVQALAEGLQRRGHDVHVVRLTPRGEEAAFAAQARAEGFDAPDRPKIHFLPIRNIYWPYDLVPRGVAAKTVWHLIDLHNLRAQADFRRLLRQIRPDVVNTSVIDGFSPAIFATAKSTGARLVHTMRDYYLICKRAGMFRKGRNCEGLCGSCKAAAAVNRLNLRHVDLFLANSDFVAQTHRDHGAIRPDQPCHVQWNANDQPRRSAGRGLGETLVFGYIGRIAPYKGLDRLLEAVASPIAAARPWELHVAGSGEEGFLNGLKEKYGHLPNVKFLGWSAPQDFYEKIDVLVCPSTYNEPLPRVIYEGYAHGLPVIASAVGGNPEVVAEGETGLLYPAEDAAALARAMEGFLAMAPEDYAARSRAALAFSARFTPDAVIDAYERRIEELFADA